MNYARPELRDLLAGEYVLGHLRGRARERFERLLVSDVAIARAVTDWQERLVPLAAAAPPVMPRRRVWRRIRRRIGRPAPARRGAWIFSARTAAAVAGAAFLAVLGLYLARPAVSPGPPARLAVIASQKGVPQWVVTVNGRRMHMRSVARTVPPTGKSYQLWMLPGGGAKPVSLGLLPASGVASETLSADQLRALNGGGGVAVSVEPAGGSPTGLPTGPVVYQAALVRS